MEFSLHTMPKMGCKPSLFSYKHKSYINDRLRVRRPHSALHTFSAFFSSCHNVPLMCTAYTPAPPPFSKKTMRPGCYLDRSFFYRSSIVFPRFKPQIPVRCPSSGLQSKRLSSHLSVAQYFKEHKLSAFEEFYAGLKSFELSRFTQSAQEFARLYDLVRHIDEAKPTFGTDAQLLAQSCLAAALFRQGAFERAEEVSTEMAKRCHPNRSSAPGPRASLGAFKDFATMVAALAAFEREAHAQENRIKKFWTFKGRCDNSARTEAQEAFFPLQKAKLCLASAIHECNAGEVAQRPGESIGLRELQILVESFAGVRMNASMEVHRSRGSDSRKNELLCDFFNLIELYNHFIFQINSHLISSQPSAHPAKELKNGLAQQYFLTAEKLLNDAAAVLQCLESHIEGGHSLSVKTVSSHKNAAQSRRPHEKEVEHPEKDRTEKFTGEHPRGIAMDTLCQAIARERCIDQVVRGVIHLHKGVGSSLLRLYAGESYASALVTITGNKYSGDGFALGQAALKKGLAVWRQFSEVDDRTGKAGLLAALAASFRCAREAAISEGLFRSALNEFASSTGLAVKTLADEAEQQLSQPQKQTLFTASEKKKMMPERCQAKSELQRSEALTSTGYVLDFSNRFEYALAMLQYNFLLTKWEGREFEAKMLRMAAAQLSPTLSGSFSDGEGRSMINSLTFSLLWKPPVTVALCGTAGASVNSSSKSETPV